MVEVKKSSGNRIMGFKTTHRTKNFIRFQSILCDAAQVLLKRKCLNYASSPLPPSSSVKIWETFKVAKYMRFMLYCSALLEVLDRWRLGSWPLGGARERQRQRCETLREFHLTKAAPNEKFVKLCSLVITYLLSSWQSNLT